ncbi:MAG: hypothetical protein U0575_12875 [Phycisphaerales bacterium]
MSIRHDFAQVLDDARARPTRPSVAGAITHLRPLRAALRMAVLSAAMTANLVPAACDSTSKSGPPSADPVLTLQSTESTPKQYATAMEILDKSPHDAAYTQALRRMIHVPGYTVPVRTMALDRLAKNDPDALQRTIEVQLPRMDALEWRTRLCEIIAERGWTQYGPTLVRAWAEPRPGWKDKDEDRPERIALEKLYGKEKLPDFLFQTLVESDAVASQNLRTRCWEMLLRTGQRDKLVALLADASIKPDDGFLNDMRAAATELGVFPRNREEILWVRKLREPSRRAFWDEARTALAKLPSGRRGQLEVRDLATVVAAAQHRPELLTAPDDAIYADLEARLRAPGAGKVHTIDFQGWSGVYRQQLAEWRKELAWGDLAAMTLALDALAVPQVVAHLFDYADRDLRDTTTEFGGVIRLDAQGRFELVEFAARVRGNDERFEAPQDMLDAAYTGLFHFHLHATKVNNAQYAAPAQGDMLYADNTRANALVFTFIDRDTLNVDFYRHGGVSVDLGSVKRGT